MLWQCRAKAVPDEYYGSVRWVSFAFEKGLSTIAMRKVLSYVQGGNVGAEALGFGYD